jgi:caffeoyl-CoA O-methyltransferase
MAERHASLREAFSRLSPCCQRLLALLIAEPPLSGTEISARLGVPAGSIGPTRSRCLEKLRRDPAIAALTSVGTAPCAVPLAGRHRCMSIVWIRAAPPAAGSPLSDPAATTSPWPGSLMRRCGPQRCGIPGRRRSDMTPRAARRRSQFIDAVIDDYAALHSTPPDAHQLELQRITQEKTGGAAGMQIGDDQAVLMEMLVRAMGATRAVEIGTFTGYSALAVARGLGPGGRLLCCDISQEWTSIARAAWQEAGVANRIELRVGPGLETLRALPPGEQFDFAFIDADKTGYAQYYEEVLARLRPGGLILLDNTLQGGQVVGDLPDDEDVAAIRSLNDAIASDPRVKVILIPIGDGVSFVQKLGERQ